MLPGGSAGLLLGAGATARRGVLIRPDALSGLLRWYSAAGVVGIADGAALQNWPDLSPNADTATQATSGSRPLFVQSGYNGKPVVRFDGVDDWMGFTAVSTIRTAIFVFKRSASFSSFMPILGHPTLFDWAGGLNSPNGQKLLDYVNANNAIRLGSAHLNSRPIGAGYNLVRPDVMSTQSVVTTGNVNAQYITNDRNSTSGGSRKWAGDIAEIILYNRALTDAELAGVENWLHAFYGIPKTYNSGFSVPIKANLVYDGDSITAGTGSTNVEQKAWPVVTSSNLPGFSGAYTTTNLGIPSQTAATIDSTTFAAGAALCVNPQLRNIYVLFAGTNDLYFGALAAAAYAPNASLVQKARLAGFDKVVLATALPRSNTGTPAGFESERQAFNTLVRANSAGADVIIDFAADSRIGDAGDELDTTYYNTDKVHPKDAGYSAMGILSAAAITPLVA